MVDDLQALADREIVVQAVVEDEAAKLDVFDRLDRVVESPEAILASETSSIPIMKLAVATARPTHVRGIHFFNPVPVLQLVELVPSLFTEDAVVSRARRWVVDDAEDIDQGLVLGAAHPQGPMVLADLIGLEPPRRWQSPSTRSSRSCCTPHLPCSPAWWKRRDRGAHCRRAASAAVAAWSGGNTG